MAKYWRLIVLVMIISASYGVGCSDLFQEDPPEPSPLDFWERPAPRVHTSGQWQPVEAPPLSERTSNDPPSFLGKVGETVYLNRELGREHQVIEVDTSTGEWKPAEAIEAVPSRWGEPLYISQWGDLVYYWVDDTLFRRDTDGGEWQEASINFAKLFEIDGTLFGYSDSGPGAAANTLFHKQPGGPWQLVHDEVYSLRKTGDIIHVRQGETHLYSDDGGQNWQEYDGSPAFFRYADGVFHDRRYWADDAVSGKVRVSDDGFQWRQEEFEGLEGSLRSLILHDGEMYGIERSEGIVYKVGEDRIVKWTGESWEPQPSPEQTRLYSLHSIGETLYLDTRSAGAWRSDDGAASWEPVGPALDVPSRVAVGDFGLCVFESIFGKLSCRADDQSSWWREGLGPMSIIERVFDDDGKLYFTVEVYERRDELYPDTELWTMASDGTIEKIAEADAARLSRLEDVVEYEGQTYLLVRHDGLYRLSDDGTSAEQVYEFRGNGSDDYLRDAAVADEHIWMIDRNGSSGSVLKLVEDGYVERLSDGFPSRDSERDDTSPRPMNFAQTDDDLYAMVQRKRFNSGGEGGVHTMAQVFAWSEERQEWLETPLPSHEELGGESLVRIEGSADALYAAGETKVFQYNPAQNAWIDISQGLPGEDNILELTVSDDRLYVLVDGHGMYEYTYDSAGQ